MTMTNPTDTPSPDRELIEDAAKTIFASMQWAARHAEKGTPPDWVERGNSLAQAEARGAARSIVESLLSDRAKLEEEIDHFLHRVPVEPGMDREPFERLAAALKDERSLVPPTNEG